jgi:hypothetical protein
LLSANPDEVLDGLGQFEKWRQVEQTEREKLNFLADSSFLGWFGFKNVHWKRVHAKGTWNTCWEGLVSGYVCDSVDIAKL